VKFEEKTEPHKRSD